MELAQQGQVLFVGDEETIAQRLPSRFHRPMTELVLWVRFDLVLAAPRVDLRGSKNVSEGVHALTRTGRFAASTRLDAEGVGQDTRADGPFVITSCLLEEFRGERLPILKDWTSQPGLDAVVELVSSAGAQQILHLVCGEAIDRAADELDGSLAIPWKVQLLLACTLRSSGWCRQILPATAPLRTVRSTFAARHCLLLLPHSGRIHARIYVLREVLARLSSTCPPSLSSCFPAIRLLVPALASVPFLHEERLAGRFGPVLFLLACRVSSWPLASSYASHPPPPRGPPWPWSRVRCAVRSTCDSHATLPATRLTVGKILPPSSLFISGSLQGIDQDLDRTPSRWPRSKPRLSNILDTRWLCGSIGKHL
eukprot:scaffold153_cov347-Pavlova_lutheri.AAC.63